jgi:hypothetical protein
MKPAGPAPKHSSSTVERQPRSTAERWTSDQLLAALFPAACGLFAMVAIPRFLFEATALFDPSRFHAATLFLTALLLLAHAFRGDRLRSAEHGDTRRTDDDGDGTLEETPTVGRSHFILPA